MKTKCPRCGATVDRDAKICVWCGLELTELSAQRVADDVAEAPAVQPREHEAATGALSASSVDINATMLPGSNDVLPQTTKKFAWLLLGAGAVFLFVGVGISLVYGFGLTQPRMLAILLNAGCGAALIMAGTRRLSSWGHSRVFAVGIVSLLVPLSVVFFPFAVISAGLIASHALAVLGSEAALLILLIASAIVDEALLGNRHKRIVRSVINNLQFVVLPMVGVTAWVLLPEAFGLFDAGGEVLGWAIMGTSSIGLLCGLLTAIWATSNAHNFVHHMIAVLLLFAFSAFWSLLWFLVIVFSSAALSG